MEVGTVRRIDIDSEMQQSYLDYAMSVIVARALPDSRDGLKPVHRRVMFAMHAMGIRPGTGFKKSARIVGEVLGKYHPHGDMAVYDAMARMAQDFSMRYALVEGQGNFGSVDGDPPAAMRYTEARLAPISMEMLADIEKETVDFVDNFDGTLQEPTVLPTAIPNLIVNGATGIAVGMATSIPPHNLGEVCDALIYMLENWTHLEQIVLDDLLKFIPGPDFPTGGILLRDKGEGEGLSAAYGTGRGKVTIQARAHIEDAGRGRSRIIVTELPYQTNKASLIERIAELTRSGQLEGLSDLRDESDRQGLRVVIELTKTADPSKVLATLYQRTPMQTTLGITMLALVEGEPRLLTLKQALRVYLDHRLDVIRRRSTFDLARARERAHILEGLRVALQHLDEVIKLIRAAADVDQARERLQRRFKLSEAQAQAILDMPLRRLAALERKKIELEYKETVARIKDLESLLRSEKRMREAIAEELRQVKASYGDRRRTLIAETRKGRKEQKLLTVSDLAPERDTWVVVNRDGLISRTPSGRLPRLAGRGAPTLVLGASSRDNLYLFDASGKGAALPVHTLPEVDDPKDGSPVASLSVFEPGEEIAAGASIPPEKVTQAEGESCLLFATTAGVVKKTPLGALPGPSAKAFVALKLADGDKLGWVDVTSGANEICLFSLQGNAIRFSEAEVRSMGLAAGGVQGMRLGDEDDRVVGTGIVTTEGQVFMITDQGQAKRIDLKHFPLQGRYGKGVIGWKSMTGVLAGAAIGGLEDRAVVHLARGPARSIRFGDAPRRSRQGGGKKLIDLGESDRVTSLTAAKPRPAFIEKPAPAAEAAKSKKASAKQVKRTEKKAGHPPSTKAAKRPPKSKQTGRGAARPKAKLNPKAEGRRPEKKGSRRQK